MNRRRLAVLAVGGLLLAVVLGTAFALGPGNDSHPLDLSNGRVPVGPEALDGLDLSWVATTEDRGGDPDEVVFGYGVEADGRTPAVVISPLTPNEEDAYRAQVLHDPSAEIDETTASCCRESILRPPRIVNVNGVDATLASISPYDRVLLVPGNPGFIVSQSTDELMIEAARGARSMTRAQLTALADAHPFPGPQPTSGSTTSTTLVR